MITIEIKLFSPERDVRPAWYWRWVCADPTCQAAESWLTDETRVLRLAGAHASQHLAERATQ